MTVSLRDAEVSLDLCCFQEQAREVVDQIALAQVLSGYVLSAISLNKKGSGATGPQKTLSTQPPPLLP